MDTKTYQVTAGSPNIVLNRNGLEKRARKLNMSENLIEELSDTELERSVNLQELSEK